jgi:hypothetical protein
VTGEGRRQISAFHIPGDCPDMQSLHLELLDSSVGTITLASSRSSSTRRYTACAMPTRKSAQHSGAQHSLMPQCFESE